MSIKKDQGSKYRVRRLFKPLVLKIAKLFVKMNISANIISLLGFIVCITASAVFAFLDFWFISILFGSLVFIAGLLDGVDGAVARLTNTASPFGGLLDSVSDRFADTFLYLGFFKYYYFQNILQTNFYNWLNDLIVLSIPIYIWVALAIIGTISVSYSRTLAEKYIKDYNCDIGLAGRSERLFILAIASWCLIPCLGLVVLTIISFLTAIYRQIKYGLIIKK